MTSVWSENSAFKSGKDLGRTVLDPYLSDAQLRREVILHLRSQFNPRKTVAEQNAESMSGLCVFVVFLTLTLSAAMVLTASPQLIPGFGSAVSTTVLGLIPAAAVYPILWGAIALMILVVVLTVRSSQRGKRARRNARQRLANAAVAGAMEAVHRRRGVGGPRTGVGAQYPGGAQYGGGAVAPGAPAPRHYEITPKEAEELAAEWMRFMGEPSAQTTISSWDGGIDVEGHFYVAQVKHLASNVGVKDIREFAGVMNHDSRGRKGLFFTRTGYVAGAVEFADRTGIALFRYDAPAGTLQGMNAHAQQLQARGLNA